MKMNALKYWGPRILMVTLLGIFLKGTNDGYEYGLIVEFFNLSNVGGAMGLMIVYKICSLPIKFLIKKS